MSVASVVMAKQVCRLNMCMCGPGAGARSGEDGEWVAMVRAARVHFARRAGAHLGLMSHINQR